jgi:hypothetical protein
LSEKLCKNLILIAQNKSDDVIKQEGRLVQVEEEMDLQPLLLSENGHLCEFIKNLTTHLLHFLETFENTKLPALAK